LRSVAIYPTEELEKIMKKPVVTVQPSDSVRRAAELMQQHDVGSAVVVEDSKPVGILTERDYIRIVAGGHTPDTKVKTVMSTPVVTCEANKKAADAFVLMALKRIDHLPVTENGLLVGIVAVRDLFFWW